MIDCREYSDNELALHVLNDECFMIFNNGNKEYLMALVAEEFNYTPTQHAILMEALRAIEL